MKGEELVVANSHLELKRCSAPRVTFWELLDDLRVQHADEGLVELRGRIELHLANDAWK